MLWGSVDGKDVQLVTLKSELLEAKAVFSRGRGAPRASPKHLGDHPVFRASLRLLRRLSREVGAIMLLEENHLESSARSSSSCFTSDAFVMLRISGAN